MLINLTKSDLLNKPIIKGEKLNDFNLSPSNMKFLSEALVDKGYTINKYSSNIFNAQFGNITVFPNHYFLFASDMYDLSIEVIKYFQIFDKVKAYSGELLGEAKVIEESILESEDLVKHFDDKEDIKLFSRFLDSTSDEFRLKGKRLIDNAGTPRSSKDCFGSIILKEINMPDSSSAIFGALMYDLANTQVNSESVLDVLYKSMLNQPEKAIENINLGVISTKLPKPFLLLAGISGTGKTRFVREQAKRFINEDNPSNYCLVPVRPDWHEPSDLLGYISRIGGNGTRYIATDFLRFMVSAWKNVAESVNNKEITFKDDDQIIPYWLCLDEMNLAPVEQYFADYLSILETRKWDGDNYNCDAIFSPTIFNQLDDAGLSELKKNIGLADSEFDDLWEFFLDEGIDIPPNLIVAGTVNMDETTHGFSRKVIDRAFTLDFGEFFPNDFDEFFKPKIKPKSLSYPTISQVSLEDLSSASADSDGKKSTSFLDLINAELRGTPFELAYRALNELLISVASFKPENDVELQAVWDDFLMTKVLPRIEGDSEKLRDDGENNLLKNLFGFLSSQLNGIWDGEHRPDFFREALNEETISIECRSRLKIKWMQERLAESGFTSFWP